MQKRYLGREKLLALGFRQIGKQTFSLVRERWEGHRFVEVEASRVTLDSRGYVTCCSGVPMLRQR